VKYSFNLVDQPWISCLDQLGLTKELSIKQTFGQAHELRGFQGESPLVNAAIYRLLLAFLHRLFGPANMNEWNKLWHAGKFDMSRINKYLDEHYQRFDLFDPEQPFFQAADSRVKQKSIISLVPHMSSGNNATLFDHHTEATGAVVSPAQAARILITAMSFGLAGLSGLKQKFTDCPSARGVTFLIEGDTLFETLLLNLIRFDKNHPDNMPRNQNDLPAWELSDPLTPNREIPNGYLDYLTWHNRRILLIPEGSYEETSVSLITVGPGLRLDASILDPLKLYRVDKKRGYLVRRFYEWRALWRDSSALFQFNLPEDVRPPLNFRWAANLVANGYLEQSRIYRYMALGMANNQAKVEFYRQEHLPLPLSYLNHQQLVENLSDAMLIAEETSKQLWSTLSLLAVLTISPDSDGKNWAEIDRLTKENASQLRQHWGTEINFWSTLNIHYLNLVQDLPDHPDDAMETWRDTVRKSAWNSFHLAQDQIGNGSAALKAGVRSGDHLALGLSRIFQQP